jgi:hypothetical protein
MGGVYGGFLEYFSELMSTVAFYSQEPKTGAGYEERNEIGSFRVILQSDGKSGLVGPAGRLSYHAQWRSLDIANNDMMWSVANIPIGSFFHHNKRDKAVYRIITQLDYDREGGFYIWGIQRVTGANGENNGQLEFAKGTF